MKVIFLGLIFLITFPTDAGEIYKIEIGKNYNTYSNRELRERIWRLERAVWQLQQKVFQLENHSNRHKPANTWVCTLSAMSDHFSASGPTKAEAKSKVINKCNKKRGSGFFCTNPKCEQ